MYLTQIFLILTDRILYTEPELITVNALSKTSFSNTFLEKKMTRVLDGFVTTFI